MIFQTLEFLRRNLNSYLKIENPGLENQPNSDDIVVLGDIGLIENRKGPDINNKVVMSLVYSEEEASLKNISPYVNRGNQSEITNPPVFLNLGIIFCGHYPSNYNESLIKIAQVVTFFQAKNYFTFSKAPILDEDPLILSTNEKDSLEISVEMMNLSMEEINHLWGILKSRVLPFVMYKVRLIKLESGLKINDVEFIDNIDLNIR